jgi:hypothetical protein
LWTSHWWLDQVSYWWVLDTIQRAKVSLRRCWVVDFDGTRDDLLGPLGARNPDELKGTIKYAKPLTRSMLSMGKSLWKAFSSSGPLAFDRAITRASKARPGIKAVRELYGRYFPTIIHASSGNVAISHIDRMLLARIPSNAWVRPIELVADKEVLRCMEVVGQTFLTYRLRRLADYKRGEPIVEYRLGPPTESDYTDIHYRLAPRGRSLLDQGLSGPEDLPRLAVGGALVYDQGEFWVRDVKGDRWVFRRN